MVATTDQGLSHQRGPASQYHRCILKDDGFEIMKLKDDNFDLGLV